MAKKPLNASLLPAYFVSDTAEEMLKWQRAQNFTNAVSGRQPFLLLIAAIAIGFSSCLFSDACPLRPQEHGGQHMVDLAYDGAFARADIADFCQAVNASRPEWIFVDDEGWPGTWGYSQYGHLSENAQVRRLPGETNFDLAYRMVDEFLHMWSSCLADLPSTSNTRTQIGYYDTTFDPGQFQPAGFVGMPSEYGKALLLAVSVSSI